MIVPAVAEVCRPQSAHSQVQGFASSRQARFEPQVGQTKPSGQRRCTSHAAQASSSGKSAMKRCSDGGRSYFQREI